MSFGCLDILEDEKVVGYHASMDIKKVKKKKELGFDDKRIYFTFIKKEAEDYLKAFKKYEQERRDFGLVSFSVDSNDVNMDWESGLGAKLIKDRKFRNRACKGDREVQAACQLAMEHHRTQDNSLPMKELLPICLNLGSEEFGKAVWGILPLGKKIPIKELKFLKTKRL